LCAKGLFDSEPSGHIKKRVNSSVAKPLFDFDVRNRSQCAQIVPILEGKLDGLDNFGRVLGQVEQRSLFDGGPAVNPFPVGFAQQDFFVDLAAGLGLYTVDMHGAHSYSTIITYCKVKKPLLVPTHFALYPYLNK